MTEVARGWRRRVKNEWYRRGESDWSTLYAYMKKITMKPLCKLIYANSNKNSKEKNYSLGSKAWGLQIKSQDLEEHNIWFKYNYLIYLIPKVNMGNKDRNTLKVLDHYQYTNFPNLLFGPKVFFFCPKVLNDIDHPLILQNSKPNTREAQGHE
jgi:hypothetical protein